MSNGLARCALFALLVACGAAPASAPVTQRPVAPAPAQPPTVDSRAVELDALTEGQHVRGFTAVALYLDDADHPIGARFKHDATGFVFDYLRIESAPQGFIYVNSFPTSDKGEPHTQEHLLLGKGDRGRKLGSSEAMALASSSAFTAQWFTAYHFHTVAGNAAFWTVFHDELDALLNPDYTDEEIRREVRNFGVDKSGDGTLRLEEKGTVYNEMVRAYEDPDTVLERTAQQLAYGPNHPLAFESGGYPAAIRTMTPGDIRAFHTAAYHLANMGMIGAFPSTMPLADVLDRTGEILHKAAGRTGKAMTDADLPRPAGAAPGTIQVADYPFATATNAGPLEIMWPPTRALDDTERTLLGLFVDALAGDASTPLYQQLIDSKTRTIDLGASDLMSWVSDDQGQPVGIVISGVKADKLEAATIGQVRAAIAGQIKRIAELPDGDPALVAFDRGVATRLVELRRKLAKLLDSPPRFGERHGTADWIDPLRRLARTPGFKKSLTLRPELAAIEAVLASGKNPWRDRVRTWGLTDQPYGFAARPSPTLRAQIDKDREQRITDELARLGKQYGTPDSATTLARYQQDYDAQTKTIDAAASAVALPPLVGQPPMTLDDSLHYATADIAATQTFTATFDSMASARIELAFNLRSALPAEDEVFLAALPTLLADAGVLDHGTPISSAEMQDRERSEILELAIHYDSNPRTARHELVVSGAGNGPTETKAALAWMRRVVLTPDWRIENLPRLRDLVDQRALAIRRRMLGGEENWVENPRDAWAQNTSLQAHTESLLTQLHDLHRIRWMLADPGDPKVTAEVTGFLATLARDAKLPRARLEQRATAIAGGRAGAIPAKLSAPAQARIRDAGKDLLGTLGELPDSSLARDWTYLCREMAADLAVGAPATLARLEGVRHQIIQGQRARLVELGSTANQAAIAADVEALVRALPIPQIGNAYGDYETGGLLHGRLREREPTAKQATFVGLFSPSTSSGVFENLAPATAYPDTSDDAMLDYLTSNLYTGHGAHSIFMKTWAAGLAYSNGLHPHVDHGTLDYYAERCPLLAQTIRFVVEQLRKEQPDANITRYALAGAFSSRIADDFETRAAAMAADLTDQLQPSDVRAFRERVLAVAERSDLAAALYGRMERVYGKVLPGYGKLDPDATYFVVGPDKQLASYQAYLHETVGKDATLFLLYPRDFWIPAKLDANRRP